MEHAAEKSHEGNRSGDLNRHQQKADATELQNIAKQETGAEKDYSGFQPELIGGDAAAKNFRNADGVGNQKPEKNGPQDVLDIREDPVMSLSICAHILF